MVNIIDGKWSNNSLTQDVSSTSGRNTIGSRSTGEGVFYLEIEVVRTRQSIGMLLSPVQDKGWVSSGNYSDSMYISFPRNLSVGDRIGVLLDLSKDIGLVYCSLNGEYYVKERPILTNVNSNIINSIKVGLVGNGSTAGTGTYRLIYEPNDFKENIDNIIDLAKYKTVYSFDGNNRLYIRRLALKNPTTNQHYSLAEKTLIALSNASDENMILHGIKAGKEIQLDEAFDKIQYINELSTATQGTSGKIVTQKLSEKPNKILKISEVKS